jgi:hypothetical protein
LYSIRGDESNADLNIKARRLNQRERTFAKNMAAVVRCNEDGNVNNFTKKERKKRCDYIPTTELLVELWHDATVMKKGKGTQVRQ